MVEVVARTGMYHPAWHMERGIAERYLEQLAAELAIRHDFLSTWQHCGASLKEVYVALKSRGVHIVDHMYRDYRSHRGWLAGLRVPPRCPPPR